MKLSQRRSIKRRSFQQRSFKPHFEVLERRHLLSGSPLPFDDSGLAPAGLQALCALPNLPVFNVKDYGAVGNGIADDTMAIRAALSAAEADGGGMIYLPAGTYDVDPQASDAPSLYPTVFTIDSSNIVFIGDHNPVTGASETHLMGYCEGLLNPVTNWTVTGNSYEQISRFQMFSVGSAPNNAPISNVQFRSLDINGDAPYTGDSQVGGDPTTGDGWDLSNKAIDMNGPSPISGVLVFNCSIENWRGEEIYSGGNLIGTIAVVSCNLAGTNADAVSCSASLTLNNVTIGGSAAGDDVYNGVEDFCFPGQSTTIQNCTIMCSSNPADPHGTGVSFEGEVGGTSLSVTNSTFENNHFGILFQDSAHNVSVNGCTFVNNGNAMITSLLGLYPGVTMGFSDFTISNNTFNSTGAAFLPQNYGNSLDCNFPNLVLSNNTVTNGYLLNGGFGGSLGGWTGFLVEDTTLGAGATDINENDQGSNVALWTGTIRPALGTLAFYDSAPIFDDYSGNSTITIRFQSDVTVLNDNTTSGPLAVTIDPTTLAGYPIGFQTTIYDWSHTNWVLQANPAWNTFSSNLPIGPNGLTIRVNSQGLFEVAPANVPITTVTSSAGSAVFGQSVTFTANVAANTQGSGTPTGTVTFLDGGTTLGTATLNASGTATFSTAALAIGKHTISVSYSGDSNFVANTNGDLTEVDGDASTSTTVSSSADSAAFGQPVTFTASVTATAPGSGTPTGMVTFLDGGTALGSAMLNASGTATFSTAALAVGTHTISVSYGGDSNFVGSTSGNLTETVANASTSTTVSSSAGSAVFGQSVTFTASVTANAPGSGMSTGTVTFLGGGTTLGTATLNASGTATFSTAALAVGSHTISVSYSGDSNFVGSTSGNLSEVVANASTSTTISSSAGSAVSGQSVTFTANVTANAPGSGTPTGTVTFLDGGTTLGTATLNASGVATLSTTAFAVGSHTISVSYGGDSNFAGNTSGDMSEVVVDPLAVTNANDSGIGSLRQAILNADALPGTTQTITFALPPESQTIDLLMSLPASSIPLVVQLDATQNVTIESTSSSILDSFSTLKKTEAGILTIAGANDLAGSVAVDAGSLTLNDSVAPVLAEGVTATVDGTGTLELAGSVSDLTSNVNISNNSTAEAGILVSGTNQIVGDIDGTGNLEVAAGGDLTANSIVQNTLFIGTGATLTIAPSGAPITNSTTELASSAISASDSVLEPAAITRLAVLRAERLAAILASSSVSTSDAGVSFVADATPITRSTTLLTAAPPVIQLLTAPQVTAGGNNTLAVATTAIVASTNIPTAAPKVPLLTGISQSPTPLTPNFPATAFVSAPIRNRIAQSEPLEFLTQVLARTELGAAIPMFSHIVTGQSPDQIAYESDPTLSFSAKGVSNGSGTVNDSESLPIEPLGTGAEDILKRENSIDAVVPSSLHEATDPIIAEGDNPATRVDDALLNLTADEVCNLN